MGTVIDVAKYQKKVNWPAVRAAGVDHAIIRLGYRGYQYGKNTRDPYFKRNVRESLACGIETDAYFLSQAITEAEAVQEVNFCVEQLLAAGVQDKVRRIIIDSEAANTAHTGRADGLSKAARTAITLAFCERVAALGYTPGVYASYSWFLHNLDLAKVDKYYTWVARYGASAPGLVCELWQYTSTGSINGISGRVDISRSMSVAAMMPDLGTATLRKGSRGASVIALQTMLNALGHACGTADGAFGVKTRTAVIAFQQAAGLAADGVVGKITRAALYAAYRAKEAA